MIDNVRINEYLRSLRREERDTLIDLKENALRDKVPIIRDEIRELIEVLMLLIKPANILEIGTGVAYSTIVMARKLADSSHIYTIENYAKRIVKAKKNIEDFGEKAKITLIEEDASKVLIALDEGLDISTFNTYGSVTNLRKAAGIGFDFIFMDGAKGSYEKWFNILKGLMHEGSLLLIDNCLQDGTLALSRFEIERRDRTIHTRMREFLYKLKNDSEFEVALLNEGDGIALCVKK